jgi:hypothetical protein
MIMSYEYRRLDLSIVDIGALKRLSTDRWLLVSVQPIEGKKRHYSVMMKRAIQAVHGEPRSVPVTTGDLAKDIEFDEWLNRQKN